MGDSAETDRLLKKISELTEILEARETKMVELSRSNLELQEQNMDLQRFGVSWNLGVSCSTVVEDMPHD